MVPEGYHVETYAGLTFNCNGESLQIVVSFPSFTTGRFNTVVVCEKVSLQLPLDET